MLQGNRNTLHLPYIYQCLPFKEKMSDPKEAASVDYSSESKTSKKIDGALYEVNGDLYGDDGNFRYDVIIPENDKDSSLKAAELPWEIRQRYAYEQLQKSADQTLQPEVSKFQGNIDRNFRMRLYD